MTMPGKAWGFSGAPCRHAACVASLSAWIDKEAWHMEYEDALVDFFQHVKVGHEKIGGLPWTEIDFVEDIEKAQADVLPRL